ncbi:MAG: hypothetical protein H7A26_06655 [Spirochaetales bacterium]|nr:hypothetical protein [Spirochaetales bacterium]
MKSLIGRLNLYIIPALVISFLTIILIISFFTDSAFKKNAYASASMSIDYITDTIVLELSKSVAVLEDFSNTIQIYKDKGITDRNFIPVIAEAILNNHDEIFSIWAVFEPDGWDGQDSAFAGTEDYDETGSYAVWAYRDKKSNSVVVSTESWGPDAYEEEYYSIPAKSSRLSLIGPYSEEITENYSIFMTTVSVPVFNKDGKVIGVAGVDISLNSLKQRIVDLSGNGVDGGTGTIVTSNGNIIADNSSLNDAEQLSDIFSKNTLFSLSDSIAKNIAVDLLSENISKGEKVYQIIKPMKISEELSPWVFIFSIPVSSITNVSRNIIIILILSGLFTILFIVAFILIFSHKFKKPLLEVAEAAGVMAQGDFRNEIYYRFNDEISVVTSGLNSLADNLSLKFRGIKEQVRSLKKNSENLTNEMLSTKNNLKDIAGSITTLIMKNSVNSKSVRETSASIEHINISIKNLEKQILNQSEKIISSSSAVEQMLANINSVAENIKRSGRYYEELIQSTDEGNELLSKVIYFIREIIKKSENLLQTNIIISDIAERTNLLSMNAAIEAAHAGDSGKGFAVVAKEIRNLADSSSRKSEEIKNNLKQITDIIKNVAVSSERAERNLKENRKLIEKVTSVEKEISHAIQEQSEGSNQIIISLTAMREITEIIRKGAGDITGDSLIILNAVNELIDSNSEVDKAINEVFSSSEEINKIVKTVNTLSNTNQNIADTLDNTVAVFGLKGNNH